MSKFIYIFREGERPDLSPTELAAHLAKWGAWVNGLLDSGHAQRVAPPLELGGKTLRGKQKTLTDGPFVEAKDVVTGVLLITADSIDVATELARGCPIFTYGGSLEVRPVMATAPSDR